MLDLYKLFCELIEKKTALYVAAQLGHTDTAIVDRWRREEKIPDSRKFNVFELLQKEGVL